MQGLQPCLVHISSNFKFCTKGGIYVSETFLVKGQYVTHILYNSLFMFEIMVIDTGVHYLDQSINENIIILV